MDTVQRTNVTGMFTIYGATLTHEKCDLNDECATQMNESVT